MSKSSQYLFPFRTAVPIFNDIDYVEFHYGSENVEENHQDFGDKIVGGTRTTIEAHPYQLSLRRDNNHECGGSILTPTRALTAAHCVLVHIDIARYSIMAGSSAYESDGPHQIRTLSRFLQHPQYITQFLSNDIAVLYWKRPLTFSATVRAIPIPTQDAAVPYGRNCNVTGWGRTRDGGRFAGGLQVVTVPLVTNEECNRAMDGYIKADMVCTGLPKGGRGPCSGDGGNPLTLNGIQVGIYSWGSECAKAGKSAVYARVAFFTNWIRKHL